MTVDNAGGGNQVVYCESSRVPSSLHHNSLLCKQSSYLLACVITVDNAKGGN